MPAVEAPEIIEARKPDKRPNRKKTVRSLLLDAVDTYHKSLKGIETHYFLEVDSQTARLLKIDSRHGRTLGVFTFSQRLELSNNSSLISALSSLLDPSQYRGEPVTVQMSFPDQIVNKIVPAELKEKQTVEQWILDNRERVFPPAGEDGISHDYYVIDKSPTQKFLCLSIIRKERFNQIINSLEESQLNVEGISSGGFYIHSLFSNLSETGKLDNLILLYLKDSSIDILTCKGGYPDVLTECPHQMAAIERTLHDISGEERGKLKLLILGNEEYLQEIKEDLHKAGYPIISKDALNENLNNDINKLPKDYWGLFALFLSHKGPKKIFTNLIAQQDRKRLPLRKLQQIFATSFKIAVVSLALLILVNLGLWSFLGANQSKLERFETKVAQIEALQKQNESLSGKINLASSISQTTTSKARLLYELGRLAPDSLWLREIGETSTGANEENLGLELAGLSASQEQVNRFLSNLENSQNFRSIKLEYLDHAGYQQSERVPTKLKNTLYKFKITVESVI